VSQESSISFQDFLKWKELGNWSPAETNVSSLRAKNPLCGDEIILNIERQESGIRIISLDGEACSVCLASAALLYCRGEIWDSVRLKEVQSRIGKFWESEIGLPDFTVDEVIFLKTMKNHPGRHRCAVLPYVALAKGF
jgi:nitrogen fixation NifU-like protein